jgi:succinyl-CoA synthetase beta subunit
VLTGDGEVLAAGVDIEFDPNARFRHPEITELTEDEEEADPLLAEATRHGLCYVRLGGTIGCMANGAGLGMASMDLVRRWGGEPASFLDVGGEASREQIAAALKLLLADAKVEGLLISMFGGVMRCDAIAESFVAATREAGVQLPVAVRLAGTNAELGRRILAESGLAIINAESLDTAAAEVVKAVREYV